MRKTAREYILTKPSTRGSNGNLYLETITVRVKEAPSGTTDEACAKVFENTCFKVCIRNATEMGYKTLLSLNRISLLRNELDSEECLHVINSLNSNISMINERILEVLLPEADSVDEHGEEVGVVADKVHQLILKNQQATKEVEELIQSITPNKSL